MNAVSVDGPLDGLRSQEVSQPAARGLRLMMSHLVLGLLLSTTPASAQEVRGAEEVWALSPDQHELLEPSSVVIDAEDGIWVADPRSGVFRWALDGTALGPVGRSGDGPGEHRLPALLQRSGDDEILLFDRRFPRVTRFRPDGSLVSTENLADLPMDLRGEVEDFAAVSEGFLLWTVSMPINRPRSYEGRARLLEASPTGRPGEVIQDLPAPEHYVDRDELNTLVVPVPHGEAPLLRLTRDGPFVLGSARAPRVRLMDADGEVLEDAELDLQGDALPPVDSEAELGRIEGRLFGELEHRQDQIPAELDRYFTDKFRRALSRLELPDSSAYLTFILSGRDGQVWLQTGERTDHGQVWRLWKPGEWDATSSCAISIAHAGEVVAGSAAGASLVLVEMLEEELPRLVRYDVEGCASG